MPKATTSTFTRPHAASARPGGKSDGAKNGESSSASASGTRNHLFNTDRFGQHILTNPMVAQGIVDKVGLSPPPRAYQRARDANLRKTVNKKSIAKLQANLKPTDIVLEVGPGTGNLTVRILPAVRKVVASEMDPRMAAEVQKRVLGKPEQKKLEIILGDFVKADLPYFDVCISNTPYQVRPAPLLLLHTFLYRRTWGTVWSAGQASTLEIRAGCGAPTAAHSCADEWRFYLSCFCPITIPLSTSPQPPDETLTMPVNRTHRIMDDQSLTLTLTLTLRSPHP